MHFSNDSDHMILVYVTCENVAQAEQLGELSMKKKLCACVNIFPDMQPMFFWPPKTGTIDKSKEVVLLLKTTLSRYDTLEAFIAKHHTYDVPCIFAIPVIAAADKYWDWLQGEMK